MALAYCSCMGWVKDRYNCTLEQAFAELRCAVIRDVNEANDLLPKERHSVGKYQIQDSRRPAKRFIVDGFPMDADPRSETYEVRFELHSDKILIRRNVPVSLPELPKLVVKQSWDGDNASCVLTLDGQQVPFGTISRIALETLFFGA